MNRRALLVGASLLALERANAGSMLLLKTKDAAGNGGSVYPDPEQTGSFQDFSVTSNANTGTVSSTITVPADAELVVVAVSAFQGTNDGLAGMTFTKGGTDTAMNRASGTADASSGWGCAMFWLALPDTGANKSLKWDWIGSGNSADQNFAFSVGFWKNVDTVSPIRDSDGLRGNSLPMNTPTLTAEAGDLILAFTGFYNAASDHLGNVTAWSNLSSLHKVNSPSTAYCEGQWASGFPSGDTAVGITTATKWNEGGLVAAVVKKKSSLSLPRVAWEGGPSYWGQFAKASAWTDSAFFPIGVYLGKADNGHPLALKDIGVNTYVGVEHQAPISQVTDHLFAIVQSPASHTSEWSQVEIGSDPKVVGWFIYDECDQGEGECWLDGNAAGRLPLFQGWSDDTRAYNDGRFLFANFGNGVLQSFWAVGEMSDFLAAVDGCSVDKYVYTSPQVRFEVERSPNWPLGDTPANNSKVSAAYGWLMDQMRTFDDELVNRRPIWAFIETKMPFLSESGREIIAYDQIEGAVWSQIVHEARGIIYFQHNGFYGAGAPSVDPNTGVAPTTETYSLVDGQQALKDRVALINSQVTALAPVLNTQSYVWNFGASGIDTMLKSYGGEAYIFASVGIGGMIGSKTFTLPSGIHGTTVTVINEARSLSVVGGAFTDTFSNEYSHHVYKVSL